jgi:hypothetical protein
MKTKAIGVLLVAVAFAGAPRLMAQGAAGTLCGINPARYSGAEILAACARFGAAVNSLETKPGYAKSAAFKALPPGMQQEALALAKKSPAERQREFEKASAEFTAAFTKLQAAERQGRRRKKQKHGTEERSNESGN